MLSNNVFLLKTDQLEYSKSWNGNNTAEAVSLASLCKLAKEQTGQDLFGDIIHPENKVVIFPNFVRHDHKESGELYSVITHPFIIWAVVDEVFKALNGRGEIIICNAPVADTIYPKLVEVTGLQKLVDDYWRKHHFKISLIDLRLYRFDIKKGIGGYNDEKREDLEGDPHGYTLVDLESQSAFNSLDRLDLLEGVDISRRRQTIQNHGHQHNRYLIANTILNSDVIVSIPKLKTHRKVGVTLNCKGMVGINGDKNYLPHFRWGPPSRGGDQFPDEAYTQVGVFRNDLARLIGDHLYSKHNAVADKFAEAIRFASGLASKTLHFKPLEPLHGDWHGNDTCWRLAADLIRIALFTDRSGKLKDVPQRKFLSIIDGIIGGENDGPISPSPQPCGVLVASDHPIAADIVGTRLMDFDYRKIQYLKELSDGPLSQLKPGFGRISPDDINIVTNYPPWKDMLNRDISIFSFRPAKYWVGHIENSTWKQV